MCPKSVRMDQTTAPFCAFLTVTISLALLADTFFST